MAEQLWQTKDYGKTFETGALPPEGRPLWQTKNYGKTFETGAFDPSKGLPQKQRPLRSNFNKMTKLTKKILKAPATKTFAGIAKNIGLNIGIFAGKRFLDGLPIALDALGQAFLGIGDSLPVVKFDLQECEEGQEPEEPKKKEDYWKQFEKKEPFVDTRLSPPPFGAAVLTAGTQDRFHPPPVGLHDRDSVPISNFKPSKLVGGVPYGDKKRCYVETVSSTAGEVGQDRCAELMERPPRHDIENFVTDFTNKITKNVTPQY